MRIALPSELEKIHNVFHVLMLRRFRSDPSHVVSSVTIELRPELEKIHNVFHVSMLRRYKLEVN